MQFPTETIRNALNLLGVPGPHYPNEADSTVLEHARTLISDRRRWTRGVLARDRQNRRVPPYDHRAVKWCALGALERAACDMGYTAGSPDFHRLVRTENKRLGDAARAQNMVDLTNVNDDYGHRAVLNLMNQVIEQDAQPE